MIKDDFGDRMKMYEGIEAERFLIPNLPICVRLDGRSFSKFTRGMKKPYDTAMTLAMIETTKDLVKETKARIGYTQSDEITLIFAPHREPLFNGRVTKLCSVLASIATARFNLEIHQTYPTKPLAYFDCRVWSVPNETEAANAVLWREFDATKNSISCAAQSKFSHKSLQGKHGPEMLEMLKGGGIDWNDYPVSFKRGTYVRRVEDVYRLTPEELEQLPPKHNARSNPNLEYIRSVVKVIDMPPFGTVKNREDVIFNYADPIVD